MKPWLFFAIESNSGWGVRCFILFQIFLVRGWGITVPHPTIINCRRQLIIVYFYILLAYILDRENEYAEQYLQTVV